MEKRINPFAGDAKKMPLKHLSKSEGEKVEIQDFPNFSSSGSITGMKNLYYGKGALLVKCGSYIYNVTSSPEIYENAETK